MVDEHWHPRPEALDELETEAKKQLQSTQNAYHRAVVPAPPQQHQEDRQRIDELQHRVEELENAPAQVIVAPVQQPIEAVVPPIEVVHVAPPLPAGEGQLLEADNKQYVKDFLDLELASPESLVLGELLRLKRGGVPYEAMTLLDFHDPSSVTMLTALASQTHIGPEDLTTMTARLVKHHKHVGPMIEKMQFLEEKPDGYRKNKVKGALEESSKAADDKSPMPAVIKSKANRSVAAFYQVAVPLKAGMAKKPALVDDLEAALKFYGRADRATTPNQRAPQQDELDKFGLHKEMCDQLLQKYTKNWDMMRFKLTTDQIVEVLIADFTDAPYTTYDAINLKLGQHIRHLKAMGSRSAAAAGPWLKNTAYDSVVWLDETGASFTVSAYYSANHLFYLYLRNRMNVYLDDIAYNDGKGLLAAINDVGGSADEFLLSAGLVPTGDGDQQQQVISDILTHFGGQAVQVYDQYFRATLGERADFMDNVVKPAASLVQAPVGFHEIGTVMKFGKGEGVWTWSNAWHTFGYTAIGIVVDLTRGSQYNKMMIEAFDPAMKNFTGWLDGTAHLYSDQASPEQKYYSDLWSTTVTGWNDWNNYLGQTTVTKMGRPFAELAQSWISTKIYGSALTPILESSSHLLTILFGELYSCRKSHV